MRKIIVTGSPGAGKSTFARKLRDKTGLPLHYLDMIWHKADKTHISREEFDGILEKILATDGWIIDGHYSRTLERRIAACDTVFLLDFPLDVCIDGIRERKGKKRGDIPWTEEKEDMDFIRYVEDFQTAKLPEIYRLLNEYESRVKIYVFRSRAEADVFLSEGFYGER